MHNLAKTAFAGLFVIVLSLGVFGALRAAAAEVNASGDATAAAAQVATQLYAQGEYALAARSYDQLIEQGYDDVELFYNRGLAYHGAGDPAAALTSLRQAAALAPRNAQIRAALAEVELAAGAVAAEAADAPRLNPIGRWVTYDELALLALGTWILVLSGLLIAVLRRPQAIQADVRLFD